MAWVVYFDCGGGTQGTYQIGCGGSPAHWGLILGCVNGGTTNLLASTSLPGATCSPFSASGTLSGFTSNTGGCCGSTPATVNFTISDPCNPGTGSSTGGVGTGTGTGGIPPLGDCADCTTGTTPKRFQVVIAGLLSPYDVYNGVVQVEQGFFINPCLYVHYYGTPFAFPVLQFQSGGGGNWTATLNEGGGVFVQWSFSGYTCVGTTIGSVTTNNMNGSPIISVQHIP